MHIVEKVRVAGGTSSKKNKESIKNHSKFKEVKEKYGIIPKRMGCVEFSATRERVCIGAPAVCSNSRCAFTSCGRNLGSGSLLHAQGRKGKACSNGKVVASCYMFIRVLPLSSPD